MIESVFFISYLWLSISNLFSFDLKDVLDFYRYISRELIGGNSGSRPYSPILPKHIHKKLRGAVHYLGGGIKAWGACHKGKDLYHAFNLVQIP